MSSRRRKRQRAQNSGIKGFFRKYYQYIAVGVLFIGLVVILSLVSHKDKADKKDDKGMAAENQDNKPAELEIPDVALETDAHEDVNALVNRYFEAMASGDTQTLMQICSSLDEREQIRIERKAEFTEGYNNLVCYTKPGPEENSYLAFAYYEIKFKNIETSAPGLTTLFIKTAADNSLYVYDGELTPEVSAYIKGIAAQDDVVDLLHKVDSGYTAAADADETLKNFMEALPVALDDAVSAELAAREGSSADEGSQGGVQAQGNVSAKVKETVNVRKSASTEGDKLGQVMGGDTVTVVASLDNGWSQIDFQGQEAYVKTEFLEIEGSVPQQEAPAEQPEENTQEQPESADNSDSTTKIGTVEAKEAVSIRKAASTDADKMGSAYKGDKFDLYAEQSDGWCKIGYNGQTAYIKTEFVDVNKN